MSGRVDGEIDMAGGSISIRADVGQDVNVAAGDVQIRGNIGGELNTAGGSVELDVIVQESAHIGGGYVLISQSSEFYGTVEIVGGEIEFLGTAHEAADLEAETLILAGTFDGDVEVQAERVRILSTAVVRGELRIRGPEEPVMEEGANISTLDYTYEAYNFGAEDWEDLDIHIDGPWELIEAPFEAVGRMFLGSAFLLGFLITLLAPRSVSNIASSFRERPVSAGLVGFVTFAMSPIVLAMLAVLLGITFIGIPLIPMMILLYPVILFFGFVFGGIAVGDLIFNRNRPNKGLGLAMRAVSLLVVMVALAVLGAVPGLGGVAGLFVMFIGLGAWMLSFGKRPKSDPADEEDESEERRAPRRRREPEPEPEEEAEAPSSSEDDNADREG